MSIIRMIRENDNKAVGRDDAKEKDDDSRKKRRMIMIIGSCMWMEFQPD